MIFVDKNIPPQQISKQISEIRENVPKNVHERFLYLVPDCRSSFQKMPFSSQFLVQAFSRCQNRKDHHTLNNDEPVKLVEIQTMFMLLSREVRFDQNFLVRNGLDGFLKLPMSKENLKVPEDLSASLTHVLQSHRGVGKTSPEPIELFIKLLKKYKGDLGRETSESEIWDCGSKQLGSLGQKVSSGGSTPKAKKEVPKVESARTVIQTASVPDSDWQALKLQPDTSQRRVVVQSTQQLKAPPKKVD